MWRTIRDEPNYEVSDKGEIRNVHSKHLKSLRLSKDGYSRVTLYPSGKTYNIHRIVAKAFIEQVEGKLYVNHKNGIKTDNSVSNLEWCTPSENSKHSYKMGLSKGKPPSKVKRVPDDLIKRIRYGDLKNLTCHELSKDFGFHWVTFRDVINFKTYKKV